ncbi:MAG: 4-alpha-glucanotransferase [Bacilli bacterium]|nr:4-alpha-glucanotransferase [Bacilli bacterium]
MKKRNVGVLLPVFSLPGNHGIGDFSSYAYEFVDWLKEHKYHYWQILPLNPVGPANSPYITVCSEAFDIRYISLDDLVAKGLLDKAPKYMANASRVKYADVLAFKEKYLRRAYKNSKISLKKFKKENPWCEEYAKYLVLKNINDNKPWNQWVIKHIPAFANDEINFHIWCQYIALNQWNNIKKYANKNGVKIIADCPFYVGLDSVDCYLNKVEFMMDEHYNPTVVSGCPPDAFSDDGQLWGTPIYNFEKMKENNYKFLINRIACLASRADILRLDHFRAFDTYCVIPAGDENARRGEWRIGPRNDFFDNLFKQYPNIQIIAEDLGILFDSVHELRDYYKLPGMRVIQFVAFEELDNNENIIVYPGTHDNQTLYGWLKSLDKEHKAILRKEYKGSKDIYASLFNEVWNMPSKITIFPMQDLIKLDDRARINHPGTVGEHNWTFKFKNMDFLKTVRYGN